MCRFPAYQISDQASHPAWTRRRRLAGVTTGCDCGFPGTIRRSNLGIRGRLATGRVERVRYMPQNRVHQGSWCRSVFAGRRKDQGLAQGLGREINRRFAQIGAYWSRLWRRR